VPLERPGNLAEKSELTNQEVEALEAAAAASRDRAVPGQVGAYNSFGLESRERSFSKQTSLIVDPPDGKLPLRPDVKAVIDARVEAKRSPTYLSASWEDRDTYERCLTRGMLPVPCWNWPVPVGRSTIVSPSITSRPPSFTPRVKVYVPAARSSRRALNRIA
jgi:hypothetical protein